jgi:hypothetical protein
MQSLKQFLLFYFIGIAILVTPAILFGNNLLTVITSPGLYILPLIFCAAGIVVGLILFELNLRKADKKKKIFFFSYCFSTLALLTVTIILGINRLREIDHKKQFGNVESNHNVMKTWVNDNEEYIRIAFNRLEKEFKNPNDFDLDAFSIRKRDTIINGIQDTIYNVYFVYFLNTDNKSKYFSKLSVFSAKPELLIYNADTRINEEYKKIKTEKDQQEYEAMKDLKELNNVLKRLKDSLKKKD